MNNTKFDILKLLVEKARENPNISVDDLVLELNGVLLDNNKTIIPIKPTDGLLISMCIRYDHSFGMDLDPNSTFPIMGFTPEQRQGLMTTMRQLHEEVSGEGFYSEENEEQYKASVKIK